MIDTRFAHIEHNGEKFQVLKYDESENPIDWDEEATHQAYKQWLETHPEVNQPSNGGWFSGLFK